MVRTMDLATCLKKMELVGVLAFATVDSDGAPQIRNISAIHYEPDAIYFFTARGKNFCRELLEDGRVQILCYTKYKEMIRMSGKAVAVDVREPDEYAVGHIPGAKLLPLGQVIDRAAEVLPDKNALWLVYCRTGRRSADAVQKLEALGYTNLRDLGGILSWPYEIEGDFEGHF